MPGVFLTTQPGRSVLTSRSDWLRDPGGAAGRWDGVEALVIVFSKCLGLMGGSEWRNLGEGGMGDGLKVGYVGVPPAAVPGQDNAAASRDGHWEAGTVPRGGM